MPKQKLFRLERKVSNMGDMAEDFKLLREVHNINRSISDEYYSEIMEKLGAKFLNSCTYRLGDFNVYTSKGFVMHKSNTGKKHDIVKWLKENYNVDVDIKALKEKRQQVMAEHGIKEIKKC